MIVRIPHTEEPDRFVFVAVRYDRETGEWIPIDPDTKPCEYTIDAARMCVQHVVPQWAEVSRLANIVRALCDHPNFEFEADGVNANMVRQEAISLVNAVTNMNYDFEYMLDGPDPDEIVHIGDKVMTGAELADQAKPEPTE